MYIGDPHKVAAMTPSSKNRAKPKSAARHTQHSVTVSVRPPAQRIKTKFNIIKKIIKELYIQHSHRLQQLKKVTRGLCIA